MGNPLSLPGGARPPATAGGRQSPWAGLAGRRDGHIGPMVKRDHTCLASRGSGFDSLLVHEASPARRPPRGQPSVGQLGSPSALGAESRRFESCHSDAGRPRRRSRSGKATGFQPVGRGSTPRCGSALKEEGAGQGGRTSPASRRGDAGARGRAARFGSGTRRREWRPPPGSRSTRVRTAHAIRHGRAARAARRGPPWVKCHRLHATPPRS